MFQHLLHRGTHHLPLSQPRTTLHDMLFINRFIWSRIALLMAIALLIAVTAGLAIKPVVASAQTVDVQQAQSQNWAGYVVHSKTGQRFSSVSGSWSQPAVSSNSGP